MADFPKIDIIDFCHSVGIPIKKTGKYYKLVEHDSCVIYSNTNYFFWNSRQLRGDGIDFIAAYYDVSLSEAIKIASNEGLIGSLRKPSYPQKKSVKTDSTSSFDFGAIVENSNNKRAFAYLSKTRKLSSATLSIFFEKRLFRQDIHGNVIFYIYDYGCLDAAPCGAILKGTLTNIPFQCCCPGSAENVGFNIAFGSTVENIYFFEAPIDLMSFYELYPAKAKNALFVGMTGLKPRIITELNLLYPQARNVLCVDNDEAGIRFCEKLKITYPSLSFEREIPKNKDWNEDLQFRKKTAHKL